MTQKVENTNFTIGEIAEEDEVNVGASVATPAPVPTIPTINELDRKLSQLLNQPPKLNTKSKKSVHAAQHKESKSSHGVKTQLIGAKGHLIALKTTIVRHYTPIGKRLEGVIKSTHIKSHLMTSKSSPALRKECFNKQHSELHLHESTWRSNHPRKAAIKPPTKKDH